jgi:hypothetical protein
MAIFDKAWAPAAKHLKGNKKAGSPSQPDPWISR